MDKPLPQTLEVVNSEIHRFLVQLLQQCRQAVEQDVATEAPKPFAPGAAVSEQDKARAVAEAEASARAPVDFVQVSNAPVAKSQVDVTKFFSGLPLYVLAEFDKKQTNIAHELKKEIDKAFLSISKPPEKIQKKKQKQANSLDDLTMVDDDLLIIRLAIDNFATKANDENKMAIAMACLRFEKVLGFEIDMMMTPASPYPIGNALDISLSALNLVINKTDVDIHRKKEILMAVLKACTAEYANLLKAVNDAFVRKGVLPKLTEKEGKARIDKYVRQMKAMEEEDKRGKEDAPRTSSGDESSPFARNFFSNIAIPVESQHYVVSNPNGVIIPPEQLLDNIGSMQSILVAKDQQSGYLQPVKTESTFSELLAANTDIPEFALTAEHSKTIGIISMLFDTLKKEEGISGPIKALLLQLTVPLLKAAVQDDEFFSDNSNPAQILFNSIAEASSSWTAESSVNNDFLYNKMSAIVQTVTENYEQDYSIFESAVDDFETFVDTEKQKAGKIEERIIAAETAQARIQAARKLAQQRIYEVFGDFILDDSLKQFIDKSWEQALFYIANNHFDDRDAPEWEQVAYIETVLSSMLSHERVQCSLDALFGKMIELFSATGRAVADVRLELEVIRSELDGVIADAEDEPVAAMPDRVNTNTDTNADSKVDKFAENTEVDFIRDHDEFVDIDDIDDVVDVVDVVAGSQNTRGETVADAAGKSLRDAAAMQQELLGKIGIGSWLEDKESNPPVKVKLAAHIKYTDTYVFVNRKGVKAVNYDGATFAARLHDKLMVVVDNSQLYDRSMENIIGSLRQ